MKDISKEIIVDDKKYKIVFNLNVMEDIQKKYGSLKKWLDLVNTNDWNKVDLSALKYSLTLMFNEAIDIENDSLPVEQKKPFLSEKEVGRIISKEMLKIMGETINESTEILDLPNE